MSRSISELVWFGRSHILYVPSSRLDSGGALSHWDTIHVSIANVHTLRVFKAIASSSGESTVKMENITAGAFLKGAFATTLRELSLTNVTNEAVCSAGTFAGNIGRVSLNRVRLYSLYGGCFNASSTWKSLNVQDSELGDISSRGILGRIEDVSFQNTSLGCIKRKGVQLNVTRLTINDSSIVRLSGYGPGLVKLVLVAPDQCNPGLSGPRYPDPH